MFTIRKFRFFVVASISLLAVSAGWAQPEDEREKLTATINAALDALYSEESLHSSTQEKILRVREVLEKNYDLNVVIRRTLGRHWRFFSEAQQVELLELVKQLVVKAYVDGMVGQLRPQVEIGKVILISEKRIEVPSWVIFGNTHVSLVYRLGRMKSGWQLYDVVAEGISIIGNYRQQIDDHFRKGDAAALIAKLRDPN